MFDTTKGGIVKTISETIAWPFTTDVDEPDMPPTVFHIITTPKTSTIESVAYFYDGTHRVSICKDVTTNKLLVEEVHSDFKKMVSLVLDSICARLNVVVPMLQRQEVNLVEMEFGMGTLIAQYFLSEDQEGLFETPVVTLSLSGDEVARWAAQQFEEGVDTPCISLGILESHDRWRNYTSYDFVAIWRGECS